MAATKPSDIPASGWNEYKLLVLKELERLDESVKGLSTKHEDSSRSLERSITAAKDAVISQVTNLIKVMDERLDKLEKEQDERLDKTEERLKIVEQDFFAIKTKLIIWGGVASVIMSGIIWLGKEVISNVIK